MGQRGLLNEPSSASGSAGLGPRRVWLFQDGEFVRLRFMTEGDEMLWERFHRQPADRFRPRVCVSSALGQACTMCDEGDWPSNHVLAWVYVYQQFYPEKPQSQRIQVKPVKVNGTTMYVEDVNEFRLLMLSITHTGPLKQRMKRYNTLLDREFELTRIDTGERKTSYSLEPLEQSPYPEELTELKEQLPDLEEVALGRGDAPTERVKEVEIEEDDELPFNDEGEKDESDDEDFL